jgi:hypothetical protein
MNLDILDKNQTLTFSEVRTLLGITMDDLMGMVFNGQIRVTKVGDVNRIAVKDLQDWLGSVTVMTLAEGANSLGLSYELTRRLVKKGVIPSIRKSRQIYILKPNKPDAGAKILADYRASEAAQDSVQSPTMASNVITREMIPSAN